MDEKMRGIIESSIDYVMKHDVVPDVDFARHVIPLTSFEDVAFGYMLGVLKQQIFSMLMLSSGLRMIPVEEKREVDKILERRVLEIKQKIMRELGR